MSKNSTKTGCNLGRRCFLLPTIPPATLNVPLDYRRYSHRPITACLNICSGWLVTEQFTESAARSYNLDPTGQARTRPMFFLVQSHLVNGRNIDASDGVVDENLVAQQGIDTASTLHLQQLGGPRIVLGVSTRSSTSTHPRTAGDSYCIIVHTSS
jgi:hypothetical protein